MITLNFSVDDQLLTRTDENTVAANSHLMHVCEFAFSSEWDGRGKVATFKKRDLMLSVILEDDACTIPPEILQSENKIDVFELSVCGADGNSTITSTVVKVPILAGTWDVMSTEITPTMFEQIMAKLEEIEENELTIEDVNNAIEEYFEEHPDLGLNPAEVFNAITRSRLINLIPKYTDYRDGLEKTDATPGVSYYVLAPGHMGFQEDRFEYGPIVITVMAPGASRASYYYLLKRAGYLPAGKYKLKNAWQTNDPNISIIYGYTAEGVEHRLAEVTTTNEIAEFEITQEIIDAGYDQVLYIKLSEGAVGGEYFPLLTYGDVTDFDNVPNSYVRNNDELTKTVINLEDSTANLQGRMLNVESGKQDKTQYAVMPAASADLLGKIYQYTGATNANYTQGHWYKCVENSGVYSWEEEQQGVKNLKNGNLDTTLIGNNAENVANDFYATALGNGTTASGNGSIAMGLNTTASGRAAHCEGSRTVASGNMSHAEGQQAQAVGVQSHAEGYNTQANGTASHAQNYTTVADGYCQTVIGKFNIAQGTPETAADNDYAFIIGNGRNAQERSNAMAVRWDGCLEFSDGTLQKTASNVQKNVMPRFSETELGKIYQYVGEDTCDKCVIVITDDDGYNTLDNNHTGLLTYFNNLNIPFTLAVPTNAPGRTDHYTLAELQAIVANGNEVVMHGVNDSSTSTQSLADFKDMIDASITFAQTNGFTDDIFVYPGGLQPNLTSDFADKIDYMLSKDIQAGYNVTTSVENRLIEGYEDWYTYVNGHDALGFSNITEFATMPNGYNKKVLLNRWSLMTNGITPGSEWFQKTIGRFIDRKDHINFYIHSNDASFVTPDEYGKTMTDYVKEAIRYIIDNYGDQVVFTTASGALDYIENHVIHTGQFYKCISDGAVEPNYSWELTAISAETLKTVVSESSDFTDFKTKIAALN